MGRQEASLPKGKGGHKKASAHATAAGQALGYSVQYTRLVAMLLEAAPGSACSLDVLDDVDQDVAGKTTLVQAKSSLTGNPVADRAVPLWKTISNWIRLVESGTVDPAKTVFELYLTQPANGDLVEAFHKARDEEEARAAVYRARDLLWGKGPNFAEKKFVS